MKKKTVAAFAAIAISLGAVNAHADVDIAGQVGTTGVGFHATMPIKPNLNARVGLGYLGYTYSGRTSDLDYDLKLTAKTYDALLDWYPRDDSKFRITTGLSYNGNKIDVRGRSNAVGSYTIQGNTYNAASFGNVTGKVDFNKVAPYLGIGWGRPSVKDKGWSFSTDLGVLFQGSPKSSLTHSGCTAPAAMCNQFSSDLAKENAALRAEVGKFKAYPVLRVGISYKF